MNKLKKVLLTVAFFVSVPVNAADPNTPPSSEGVSATENCQACDLSFMDVVKSHQTCCDMLTIVAAATLIKYSWQLGKEIGDVIATFRCKKKCKKA